MAAARKASLRAFASDKYHAQAASSLFTVRLQSQVAEFRRCMGVLGVVLIELPHQIYIEPSREVCMVQICP